MPYLPPVLVLFAVANLVSKGIALQHLRPADLPGVAALIAAAATDEIVACHRRMREPDSGLLHLMLRSWIVRLAVIVPLVVLHVATNVHGDCIGAARVSAFTRQANDELIALDTAAKLWSSDERRTQVLKALDRAANVRRALRVLESSPNILDELAQGLDQEAKTLERTVALGQIGKYIPVVRAEPEIRPLEQLRGWAYRSGDVADELLWLTLPYFLSDLVLCHFRPHSPPRRSRSKDIQGTDTLRIVTDVTMPIETIHPAGSNARSHSKESSRNEICVEPPVVRQRRAWDRGDHI